MTTPEEFVEVAAAAFEHTLRQAIAGAAPAAPESRPSDAVPSGPSPSAGEIAEPAAAYAFEAGPSLGDPSDLGERAALLVVAQSSWRSHLGTLFDTAEVQALLGVGTRQAVSDRARRGGLLMLSTADGRRHYPAFQFGPTGQPFAALPRVLAAFADADVSPYTIASWFRTPQAQLEGATPAQWMGEGRPDERLLDAARRTASRFAH